MKLFLCVSVIELPSVIRDDLMTIYVVHIYVYAMALKICPKFSDCSFFLSLWWSNSCCHLQTYECACPNSKYQMANSDECNRHYIWTFKCLNGQQCLHYHWAQITTNNKLWKRHKHWNVSDIFSVNKRTFITFESWSTIQNWRIRRKSFSFGDNLNLFWAKRQSFRKDFLSPVSFSRFPQMIFIEHLIFKSYQMQQIAQMQMQCSFIGFGCLLLGMMPCYLSWKYQ